MAENKTQASAGSASDCVAAIAAIAREARRLDCEKRVAQAVKAKQTKPAKEA